MLIALAAAAIPIIIEWLFRKRRRQVELPTIRFLLRTTEQKKVRRQDRLLLLLRIVGIALLVAALARPWIRRGLLGRTGDRNVIVLLDGTASMNQQAEVTTAFGWAQKKAAAMIRGLPEGTTVSVGLLGERVESVAEGEKDVHTAAAKIESLRAGSGSGRIADGLAWARRVLDEGFSANRPAEVYILSDFQRSTWIAASEGPAAAAAELARLGEAAEVCLVDVGGEAKFNYMVTDLRPAERAMSAGMPVTFRATVASTGRPPDGSIAGASPPSGASATVTLLVNGEKKSALQVVPMPDGVTVTFEHVFAAAGEYLVEAVIDGDEHEIDNRRLYLAAVPEDIEVLILDDTVEEAVPDSVFLSRAVSPPVRPGMTKVSRFAARTIVPSRLAYENVNRYAAVIVAGPAVLPPEAAGTLGKYVADGGAVWIFAGPRSNLYEYNRLLYRDDNGTGSPNRSESRVGVPLLPARLKAVAAAPTTSGDSTAGVAILTGDPGAPGHPALAALSGRAGDPSVRALKYVELDELVSDAEVWVRFEGGAPAMVEKRFGRGKVLLTATSPGVAWTNWPASPDFAVLVQEVLRYLLDDPDRSVNLRVGQSFVQPVFVSSQHLLLRRPDGQRERLTPVESGGEGTWQVSYDRTDRQGVYEIDAPEQVLPRRRFVVNAGADEGDLARLDEATFKRTFGSTGGSWIAPDASLAEHVAAAHSVTELSPPLLWGLVGVLVIESFLAARFGRRRSSILRPQTEGASA